MWFPYHYRDASGWRSDKLAISTPSDEAAKFFDCAVTELVFHDNDSTFGDLPTVMQKMMECDPDFVMGNVFNLSLQTWDCNPRKNKKLLYDVNSFIEKASLRDISPWYIKIYSQSQKASCYP